jgi:hypothetical protein
VNIEGNVKGEGGVLTTGIDIQACTVNFYGTDYRNIGTDLATIFRLQLRYVVAADHIGLGQGPSKREFLI